MSDFDPDAYLADKEGSASDQQSGSFDPDAYIAGFDPDAYLADKARPEAESVVPRAARNVAHGMFPAATAMIGAGVGGALGAAAGAAGGTLALPVVGTVSGAAAGGVAGNIAGGMAGAYIGEKIQHGVQNVLGIADDEQMAANAQEHPIESSIEQMLPMAATLRPDKLASVGQRLASGALMGGVGAVQEAVTQGTFDPTQFAINVATGAALPATNRVGTKLMGIGSGAANKFIPGRPGKVATPESGVAKEAVDEPVPTINIEGSSLAQTAPQGTEAKVTANGNPQSAPQRDGGNDGRFSKKAAGGTGGEPATTGDIAPDKLAALAETNPEPAPAPAPAAPPIQRPFGMPAANYREPIPGIAESEFGQQPRQAPPVQSADTIMGASQLARDAQTRAMQNAAAQSRGTGTQPTAEEMANPAKTTIDYNRAAAPAREVPEDMLKGPEYGPQVIDTGFPKPGEPVAFGENEGVKVPEGTPERFEKAAAAVEMSKNFGKRTVSELRRLGYDDDVIAKMKPENAKLIAKEGVYTSNGGRGMVEPKPNEGPNHTENTRPNEELSSAQKEAGNYKMAEGKDFGKDYKIETMAGDIRRSKDGEPKWEVEMPVDYGYFKRTKSTDGEGIDKMTPKRGSPDRGNEHFIIDQKNLQTGKYDEPKTFTDVKDEATARRLYEASFSDGKGADRIMAMTPVSRAQLVNYLNKHTTVAPTKPYGKVGSPVGKPKPVAERAVVKAAKEALIAKGDTEGLAQLEAKLKAEPEKVKENIANQRLRNRPVIEGLLNAEGKPVTAEGTVDEIAAKSAKHKAVQGWFEDTKPPSQMDVSSETPGETLDRVRQGWSPEFVKGWKPTYSPKEWLLMNEAKNLMAKPTSAKQLETFRNAERLLRGGDGAVESYRAGKREAGEAAFNKRTGNEVVENAQNKEARAEIFKEEPEQRIDKEREEWLAANYKEGVAPTVEAPSTDVPAVKTVNAATSTLARSGAELGKVHKTEAELARANEAFKLAGREAKPEKREAAPIRHIDITDPEQAAELVRRVNALKKDAKEYKPTETLPPDDKISSAWKEFANSEGGGEFAKGWKAFMADEGGSLNIGKIKQDFKNIGERLKERFKNTAAPNRESSFARTPKPEEINAEYTRSLGDRLHKANQWDKQDMIELQKWAKKLMASLGKKVWGPKDLVEQLKRGKDQRSINKLYQARIDEALTTIYDARDADSANVNLPGKLPGKTNVESLHPNLYGIYKVYLEPVLRENDEIAKILRQVAPDKMGPEVMHHMAHIVNGYTADYNLLRHSDDPTGANLKGMAVDASMAHERPFVALERVSDGKRFVVQNHPGEGFTLWEGGKGGRIKDDKWAFEDGNKFTVTAKDGNKTDYIMRNAMAKEIEANARGLDGKGPMMKYYRNAALAAFMTNAKMGSMLRHTQVLADMQKTPEWEKMAAIASSPQGQKMAKEAGWEKPLMPNFQKYVMDPQLRYVLDDYAKPGFNSPDWARELSQGVTKLLFWSPTAHAMNVGAHWAVGRGWDWITPSGTRSLAVDGWRAIRSVMSQDEYQKILRGHGAGTIMGGVETRGFVENLAKRFGEEIKRDPTGDWKDIAAKIGVPAKALAKAIYDTSSHMMWSANDVFLTQRIMELERKGLSIPEAIAKAEKDIPNYRLPTTIGGSGKWARRFQQVLADPLITSFGRYHYGMFNSYANIIKEALSPHATMAERTEAAGKMLMMGFLAYAVYPVMDKVWSMVTGNEDAKANRRGPIAIPSHLKAASEGHEDIMSAARSTLTLPPLVTTIMETIFNKDFRGKNVVEPGDVAAAFKGSPSAALAVGTQFGEHLARGLISPLGTLSAGYKKQVEGKQQNPAQTIRDQLLDIKNPSDAARAFARKQDIINFRNAQNRKKHGGSGMLEDIVNKVTGR